MTPSSFSLTKPGRFVVGVNYWASHAGTRMWDDWQPQVVVEDLRQLSEAGLQVLRVFPLWPTFQPISLLRGGQGAPREYRFGEAPLPPDAVGQAGVSQEALQRFLFLADTAEQYGLKLVVGLLTGWMSGRLYVPPALEGLNVLTDPTALMWETRFVRVFVQRFKDHPAIAAWDLGNECNVMGATPSRAAAWAWTAAITNAIRAVDASKPVVSGMHSLSPAPDAHWTMQDQAELTDLLTTHPYPFWTPYCDQDPANTIRTILHSTAESRMYADIGGKPCIAEELGTLGPFLASERIAGDFVHACLFSLWANDCQGLLWWCAYDQLDLEQAPYDWNACERELGLVGMQRRVKPMLEEMGAFRRWLEQQPFEKLPARLEEAVCILTEGQDPWAVAFSSQILAKQAGFDLTFQYADQPIKPASLYLLPSVRGDHAIPRRRWLELMERIRQGATLYLSHHDSLLSSFKALFGLEVQTRQRRSEPAQFTLPEVGAFAIDSPIRLNLRPCGAEVLAAEPDGNPLFTRAALGEGQLYFLSVPLEDALTRTPGAFHSPEAQPFWKIYLRVAEGHFTERVARKDHAMLGLTEHPIHANERLLVLVNYSPEEIETGLELKAGWQVTQALYGAPPSADGRMKVAANNGLVLRVETK